MGIRSQEPDPGKKQTVTRWTYLSVPNGGRINAFLAASPTGAWVHHVGSSRPCRAKMSEGRMACPYCADGMVPDWRGYTPLYTAEYTRAFVLISFEYLESVREIGIHDQVEVSRAKDQRAPVIVRPKLWRTSPLPKCADRDRCVDMMSFLVGVLWRDAELLRYHQSAVVPDSDKLTADQLAEVNRLDPMYRAAMARAMAKEVTVTPPKPDDAAPLSEVYPELIRKVSKNGKHPK